MTAHVVLHASAYDAHPSGARRRAAGLAAAFLRAGHRVTVQTAHGVSLAADVAAELGGPPPAGAWTETDTGLTPDHPLLRLRRAPDVAQRLLPRDADLFVTDYHPVVEGVPTALTVHDLRYVGAPHDEAALRAVAFRATFPALARRAALLTVPTAAVGRELAAFLPDLASRIVVAPNAPGRAWREAPRCEGAGRHFAIVGIAERRKRLDLLLEAVRRARRLGPVLPVVAVGRRPGRWAFDAVPGGAGRHAEGLAFAGGASDAEALRIVRDAAALLHPSRYEGFGLPVVEAFACGVPVLAARGAAVEEVAGDLATWVEDDPDAWAAALLDLSAEPWARLAGRDERRTRAASFTWDAAAAAILAALAPARR